MRRNSDIASGRIAWLDLGAPELLACLGRFRMVLIGDFPFLYLEVHRRIWRLIDQEIVMPDTAVSSDFIVEICTFVELHSILRRDRRIGLRQWREMGIRRIRTPLVGFPYDFGRLFRNSDERRREPPVLSLGRTGPLPSWDMATTGVSKLVVPIRITSIGMGIIRIPGIL